ncbi:DsbA family protein [Gordonia shandongensis]|uniref:DsbA family protein n=1 Tax=Gordonia shandongensis TaxID=376351 RepID=UPI000408E24D|nr:thioredoxin domain-containing protein [Gordonia shandongensis]
MARRLSSLLHPSMRRTSILVPIVVVAVAVAAVVFVIVQSTGGDDGADRASDGDGAPPPRSEWEDRDPDDPMAFGRVDAPVGLVMFTDYQCPYCAQWTQDTLPTLMKYVDDGRLRIELRDMNIFGPESENAARAAYSAGLQGRLREYNAALFAGGKPRPKSRLTDAALIELAGELGLDVARFRADLSSQTVLSAVRNKASDGFTAGTYTTPAFIIADKPILGSQPTKVFTDAVDKALGD